MRSRSSVKQILPCLAVILAVGATPIHAQAGVFDVLKQATSILFGGAQPSAPIVAPLGATDQNFDPQTHLVDRVISVVNQVHVQAYTRSPLRSGLSAEAVKVASVGTDTHTDLQVVYSEEGAKIQFIYDEAALKSPDLLLKDLAVLTYITQSEAYLTDLFTFNGSTSQYRNQFSSPHGTAELMADAQAGSPTALARVESIQVKILEMLSLNPTLEQTLGADQYLKDLLNAKRHDLPALESRAQDYARKQQKALDKWKSETQALDKYEAMPEKLDDLIMKNDRKGVADMLRAYLPWSVMEPVETKAWKTWLDAIEHPDTKNTTVAFRGLKYDTDKIQRRETAQGEIFGFMSTVLTKNQGSYTRRLRSLSTNREKNGDEGFVANGSKLMTVKITDQMTAHARDPKASSFLSFTYDPNIARAFAGTTTTKMVKGEMIQVPYGGILVVKMDSRRMIPNVPSMYGNEIELLAPLIIFPDEVVAYKEGAFDSTYTYAQFIKDISDKTGVDFVNWQQAQPGESNASLVQTYKRDGFKFLGDLINTTSTGAGGQCSKILL